MKKIWLKGTAENTTYYYLASDPYTHEIIKKDELTPDKIQDIVDRKGYSNKDWGQYVDVIFPKEETASKREDAIELPPGIYRLKPSDGKPLRLEEMTLRDDSYIPLDSHLSLVKDIGKFLTAKKDIYEPLEWPYRRGYLLYGEPGTGKTAFIRYLCQMEMFKQAHCIWMDFVPPAHFVQALNDAESMKIIIMEELLGEGGRLSYDMQKLLEFLDGENSLRDCVSIATTNYPHFLHKNLADRHGRFDILFEMERQPRKVSKSVIEKWLGREIDDEELRLEDYSLAQLKEIVLLHKFFEISLGEASKRLKEQSEKFKNEFMKKAKSFGLSQDKDEDDYDD